MFPDSIFDFNIFFYKKTLTISKTISRSYEFLSSKSKTISSTVIVLFNKLYYNDKYLID